MYNDDLDLKKDSDKSSNVNLDELIEGLSSDIENVNNIISGLHEQKKTNTAAEQTIIEERKKLEKDKLDFEDYVSLTISEIEEKKKSEEVIIEAQKLNLSKAEQSFKENMDRTLSELELAKKDLELRESKVSEDEEQFNKFRELELARIKQEKEVLEAEKEQFEQYKEVNTKRIEVENKNLEQQFNKFKAVIDQFNINFKANEDKE